MAVWWEGDVNRILKRKTLLSDYTTYLLSWKKKMIIHSISSSKTPIKYIFAHWVSDLWQVWHQATSGWMMEAVPVSLPQYDMHRF